MKEAPININNKMFLTLLRKCRKWSEIVVTKILAEDLKNPFNKLRKTLSTTVSQYSESRVGKVHLPRKYYNIHIVSFFVNFRQVDILTLFNYYFSITFL